MALVRWDFESGSNGDAITAGNTGSSFVVVTGGTGTISTANSPPIGTRSISLVATVSSGGIYVAKNSLGGVTSFALDALLYVTTAPSGNVAIFWVGTGSRMVSVEMTSTRTLVLKNAAGTTLYTTSAVPAMTWVRVSLFATQNASTGTVRLAFYPSPSSTTATDDSTLLTGRNTGAAAYTDFRVGSKTTTGTQTGSMQFDAVGYDTAASGLNPPPTLDSSVPAVVVDFVDLAVIAPSVYAEAGVSGGGPVGITLAAVAPVVSGQRQPTVVAVDPVVTVAAVVPAVLGQRNASTAAVALGATLAAVAPVVSGSATVAAVPAVITVAAGVPVASVGGSGAVTAVAVAVTLAAGAAPVITGQRHASVLTTATAVTVAVPAPAVAGTQNASSAAVATAAQLAAVPPVVSAGTAVVAVRPSVTVAAVAPVAAGSATVVAVPATLALTARPSVLFSAAANVVAVRVLLVLSFAGSPIIRTVTPVTPRDRVWLVATRSRRYIVEGR